MHKSEMELGFLDECEPWQVESRLFPSKVGGKPAWLNLDNLPSVERLQCKKCQNTMIFLCQLYAPYEEDLQQTFDHYLNNFHRTLFVFICKNPKCCERNKSDNVKVFRSSLQRDNRYYSYDPPEDEPMPTFSLSNWVKLCNLCGCLSEKQCSKCKEVHYCSREHQVLDWKEGHKQECGVSVKVARQSKILFPEWEIITETEDSDDTSVDEEEQVRRFKQLEVEGKTGTMPHIPESELDAHASEEADRVFLKFRKKVSSNPDQVIRYKRDGEPLWIAKEPLPESIPDCELCGSPRQFEFQVMPQLLASLKENDLDFGVLVVYTCKKSCVGDSSYKEEFVFKQDVELTNV